MPNIVLPDGYEESIGSQEEILERARQEAIVQRRVVELRKQGLWSQKRMPKVSSFFLTRASQTRECILFFLEGAHAMCVAECFVRKCDNDFDS